MALVAVAMVVGAEILASILVVVSDLETLVHVAEFRYTEPEELFCCMAKLLCYALVVPEPVGSPET